MLFPLLLARVISTIYTNPNPSNFMLFYDIFRFKFLPEAEPDLFDSPENETLYISRNALHGPILSDL